MRFSSLLYLIATILFILAVFEVTLGGVPMVTLALAFVAGGLFVDSTAWDRSLNRRVR